jgi:hypothetical protein
MCGVWFLVLTALVAPSCDWRCGNRWSARVWLVCFQPDRQPWHQMSTKHLFISSNDITSDCLIIRKMFARCVPRQAARRVVRSIRSSHQMPMKRRYSNSSVAPTTSSPSPGAALGGLNTELDKLSPRFDISSSQIEILRSPSDFYETLKASWAITVSYLSLSFPSISSEIHS